MTNIPQQDNDLVSLLEKLPRGGKRTIARLLRCSPGKITDAKDGFVKDQDFINRLTEAAIEYLNGPSVAN